MPDRLTLLALLGRGSALRATRRERVTRVLAGLLASLAAALASSPAVAQEASPARGRITVIATGVRSDDGVLRCLLFDDADAFPRRPERAFAASMGRISEGVATCTFEDIPAGRYAIAVHHDQNANGRVDTGLFGIPTEGLGASNDAAGSFGPPAFDAASFPYEGTVRSMRVRMGYVF